MEANFNEDLLSFSPLVLYDYPSNQYEVTKLT